MEKYVNEIVKNIDIKVTFVKALAKNVQSMETEEIKINYGGKELLYKTFQNCAMALKGDMFNLLIETTSNIIKNIIIQGDRKIEDEIYDKIIDKFINYDEFICIEIIKIVYNFLLKYKEFHKYISVLSEEEFQDHIIKMIANHIFLF